MGLRIHNSLTGRKEDFEPIERGHVRMYVCGITVYDHVHVGHVRSQLAFDVVRFVPHPVESGESKVFLSKRLGQHVIDSHRSRRSVQRDDD